MMKKSLLAGLIGMAIIIAIDAVSRVFVSLYLGHEILMFAYSAYPGSVVWPVLLTLIAGFSTFFGALFCLSYNRDHQVTGVIFFLILLIILRYGQIHLLMEFESLFYPVTALVLSLGGLFIAWQLARRKKNAAKQASAEPAEEYHFPREDQGQHSGTSGHHNAESDLN